MRYGEDVKRLLIGLGMVLAIAGLVISLYPFVSIWQAGGRALGQLPEIDGRGFSDERNGLGALFDEDMTVARRTYSDISPDRVVERLAESGFQSNRGMDHHWYVKECCGSWDAVVVRAEPVDTGAGTGSGTELIISMQDQDIQSSWPVLVLFGLPFVAAGSALVSVNRRRSKPGTMPAASSSQVTTTA